MMDRPESPWQDEDAGENLPPELEAALQANYPQLQYQFVSFFTDHVAGLSRAFGGDLEAMLIFAIVAQVYLHEWHRADGEPRAPEASISSSRIASITAIPRQTIRRKLALLQERGWVEQCPSKGWQLAWRDGGLPAQRDLGEVSVGGLRRALRLAAILGRSI